MILRSMILQINFKKKLLIIPKNLINKAVEISGCKNVVLSGGYALNCLNNYQYLDIDPEINLYVDPVSMMLVLP